MTSKLIILVTALGSGLIAGTFFAFSSFIMVALARLPPSHGIEAMQSINIVVINPVFMAVLFGMAVVSVYHGFVAWQYWDGWPSAMLLAAALFYLLGVIGVTMLLNVPLNDALAAVQPGSSEAEPVWQHYLAFWTLWNHVRCTAASIAMGLYAWRLVDRI